jgi:hypothetical protein
MARSPAAPRSKGSEKSQDYISRKALAAVEMDSESEDRLIDADEGG